MYKVFRPSSSGFTIFELAIAITIFGIVITGFAAGYLNFQRENRIRVTENRMKAIEGAIYNFLELNGRYPCPASRIAGADNPSFGIEANKAWQQIENSGAVLGITSCNNEIRFTNAPGGSGAVIMNGSACPASAVGSNDRDCIATGSIPVRDLGLPDEFISDGWGGRLTYAVNAELASPKDRNSASPDPALGYRPFNDADGPAYRNFDIKDLSGNPYGVSPDFILLSHGEDREGALTRGKANRSPTVINSCAGGSGIDPENCDIDTTYIKVNYLRAGIEADSYDDILMLGLDSFLVSANRIPVGTIMYYDYSNDGTAQGGCPDGWENYNNTVQGRIMLIKGTDTPANIANNVGFSAPNADDLEVFAQMDADPTTGSWTGDALNAFTGGTFGPTITDKDQLPLHEHQYRSVIGQIFREQTASPNPQVTVLAVPAANSAFVPASTELTGDGRRRNHIPSFVALITCRKI